MFKEYVVLIGLESFKFKNPQDAFSFYDKRKEESRETCVLYEITTKELDVRYNLDY